MSTRFLRSRAKRADLAAAMNPPVSGCSGCRLHTYQRKLFQVLLEILVQDSNKSAPNVILLYVNSMHGSG